MELLNLSKESRKIREAKQFLSRNMIGQKEAQKKLMDDLVVFHGSLRDRSKPIGARILAGSSGVGKTHIGKLLAWILFGAMDQFDPEEDAPITLINGSEYQSRHEYSKLIGTTSGYTGYHDNNDEKVQLKNLKNPSLLAQENINSPHALLKMRNPEIKDLVDQVRHLNEQLGRMANCFDKESRIEKQVLIDSINEKMKEIGPSYSVIIFDEIEKAHTAIWNLLLQIIHEGKIVLGNGEITHFHNSFILLTSNIGQDKIKKILSGKPSRVGLGAIEETGKTRDRNADINKKVRREIKSVFPTELLSRFGGEEEGVIVFYPFVRDEVRSILEIKFAQINKKLKSRNIALSLSESAKNFMVEKGHSELYGARIMDMALKKYLLKPLSVMISLRYNAKNVFADYRGGEELSFYKKKTEAKRLSA